MNDNLKSIRLLTDAKGLSTAERNSYWGNCNFDIFNNNFVKITQYVNLHEDTYRQRHIDYYYIDKVIGARSTPKAYTTICTSGFGFTQEFGVMQFGIKDLMIPLYCDNYSFTDIEFITKEEFNQVLEDSPIYLYIKELIKKIEHETN